MNVINTTEQNESGLLPYPVIIAANKGDPEAMQIVVHHYGSYIAYLYAKAARRARKLLLGHGRGHTRPLAVKAHASCPCFHDLTKQPLAFLFPQATGII